MQLTEFIKSQYRGQIREIIGEEMLTERLLEMGIFKGQQFEFLGRAPFYGPMIIKIGATVIALRLEEAQCLIVHA